MQLVQLFRTATIGGLVAFALDGLLVASAVMLAWHYGPQPVQPPIQPPASKPEMPTPPPMRAGVN